MFSAKRNYLPRALIDFLYLESKNDEDSAFQAEKAGWGGSAADGVHGGRRPLPRLQHGGVHPPSHPREGWTQTSGPGNPGTIIDKVARLANINGFIYIIIFIITVENY